jgi:AcrR family transcriptional regulator
LKYLQFRKVMPVLQDRIASTKRTTRQAMRSEATRKALLAAAQKVFSRDGFEAARIEDIAAEAGRSRGAFYANFSNKEQAFFALREQAIEEYEAEVSAIQARNLPLEDERTLFERWVAARIPDQGQILLQLEFKQFAVRHPEVRRKLLEQHLRKVCKVELQCTEGLLPGPGSQPTIDQQRRMLLIEAVIEGLALSCNFSPEVMTRDYIGRAVKLLLGAVLQGSGAGS